MISTPISFGFSGLFSSQPTPTITTPTTTTIGLPNNAFLFHANIIYHVDRVSPLKFDNGCFIFDHPDQKNLFSTNMNEKVSFANAHGVSFDLKQLSTNEMHLFYNPNAVPNTLICEYEWKKPPPGFNFQSDSDFKNLQAIDVTKRLNEMINQ